MVLDVLLSLAGCTSAVPVPPADSASSPTDTAERTDTGDTAGVGTTDTGPEHPLQGWDTGEPVDCTATMPDIGPFPSDAPAWDVQIERPDDDWRFGLIAATYTADGRPLAQTVLQTEGGITTTWTYLPGDWRIATVDTSGIFPPWHEDWSWNTNLATVEQTFVPTGEITTQFRTFLDGGLPLATIVDEQVVSSWTYLGPGTWQLAETDSATWSWDCLTGTSVATGAVRRRFHPDGRVRFEARDADLDGVDEWSRTVRYEPGDSWRIDYELVDPDGDGPEPAFVVDWNWTAL